LPIFLLEIVQFDEPAFLPPAAPFGAKIFSEMEHLVFTVYSLLGEDCVL
jgi:hypothetical protein